MHNRSTQTRKALQRSLLHRGEDQVSTSVADGTYPLCPFGVGSL